MFSKIALFKISRNSVISNINFADVKCEDIPHSVTNARTFDSRDDLQRYIHANHVNHPMMFKCNFDNCAHNGADKRKVPHYGLYGHFSDGTPYIVQDLHLYGQGTNLYYRGLCQDLKRHDYVSLNWSRSMVTGEHHKYVKSDSAQPEVKTYTDRGGNHVTEINTSGMKKVPVRPHRQEFYYNYESWKSFSIPVDSTLGRMISWFIELGYPEPVSNADASTQKNNSMKFPDKRPYYAARQNPAPDRTHAGKRFV